MTDRNVEAVRQLLLDRSEVGIKKYGTTTDRNDLSLYQWLNHALMESLDQCVYLKRAITKLEEEMPKPPPPIPPDHGPKLNRDGNGHYYIDRRMTGVTQQFRNDGEWTSLPRDGSVYGDAPSALRALAKATGWEIEVKADTSACWIQSGPYRLDQYGTWERGGGTWLAPFAALAIKRDCEARGHYPAAMCDRGEVGNG